MSHPVPGNYKITTPYGVPGSMWSSGHHQGVDFACPVGTPVYAPIDGTVVGVGRIGTWGSAFGRHAVIIEFTWKRKKHWVLLAHCSGDSVKIGDKVVAGQRIATSGAEGNVTGAHVHLEVQTRRWWSKSTDKNPQFVLDYPAKIGIPIVQPTKTSVRTGKLTITTNTKTSKPANKTAKKATKKAK